MDLIETYGPILLLTVAALYIGFKVLRAFMRVRGLSVRPATPIAHFTDDNERNPFDFTGIGEVGSLYNPYDESNPYSAFYDINHHDAK